MRLRTGVIFALAVSAACGDNSPGDCDAWRQWGNNASHDGASCVAGQPLGRVLSDVIYDTFTPGEEIDAGGDLVVHYQAPLIEGDDVYMMQKTGTYTACKTGMMGPDCYQPDELYRLNSQVWTETRYTIDASGNLTERWSFDSDWKPEPWIGFEPMFQPALVGDLIAIPGAGGSLWELDRSSGKLVRQVMPFGSIDPDLYVAGGIAVTADRTIYYNTIKLGHAEPFTMPSQSWLVQVRPDGGVRTGEYATLIPGAPAADDLCYSVFNFQNDPLPWPPPPNLDGSKALPKQFPCGAQRAGINSTPAVGADGTIFVGTHAQHNERYSYLVGLRADLTLRWATSLQNTLNDGCGVTLPSDGNATDKLFHCRPGTTVGVDPATNLPPAAMVDDSSSSSPVALPDGGVIYGALTGYNGSRGHLIKLDADGQLAGTYDFGWDTTPSVVASGTDYKIILKDNHYGQDENGVDLGPYYITELDSSLHVAWQFQSTQTQSCVHELDGSISCKDDHPHGFEWCINAPAVDENGVTYANSEDGNLYAITADGQLRDQFFLDRALGAAYTPLALDHRGRIFALNNGHLTVVGK